uniref:Uncharacterized protein n=1 Tax=Sus scrofa TaxID=9823 RepID=A0A8D1IQZ7_PIG
GHCPHYIASMFLGEGPGCGCGYRLEEHGCRQGWGPGTGLRHAMGSGLGPGLGCGWQCSQGHGPGQDCAQGAQGGGAGSRTGPGVGCAQGRGVGCRTGPGVGCAQGRGVGSGTGPGVGCAQGRGVGCWGPLTFGEKMTEKGPQGALQMPPELGEAGEGRVREQGEP